MTPVSHLWVACMHDHCCAPEGIGSFIVHNSICRDLAIDVATGSGQAAVDLAQHFVKVVAMDGSAEQIRTPLMPQEGSGVVEYRVADAHDMQLPAGCADIVTAASALHWWVGRHVCVAHVCEKLRPT